MFRVQRHRLKAVPSSHLRRVRADSHSFAVIRTVPRPPPPLLVWPVPRQSDRRPNRHRQHLVQPRRYKHPAGNRCQVPVKVQVCSVPLFHAVVRGGWQCSVCLHGRLLISHAGFLNLLRGSPQESGKRKLFSESSAEGPLHLS